MKLMKMTNAPGRVDKIGRLLCKFHGKSARKMNGDMKSLSGPLFYQIPVLLIAVAKNLTEKLHSPQTLRLNRNLMWFCWAAWI